MSPPAIRSGFADVNETRLYYELYGTGPPLVLINAGFLDFRMWDPQLDPFAEHFTVLRYDYRGIGKSETPKEPYSDVIDLFSLLKFLGLDRVCLLGLSAGGSLAIDFAIEHPAMVRALIPVSSSLSGYAYSDEHVQRISNLFLIAKEKGPEKAVLMILSNHVWSPGHENTAGYRLMHTILLDNFRVFVRDQDFEQPISPPAIQRLSEINVPVLIILGERDYPDIHAIGDKLKQGVDGAMIAVIDEAGHFINIERTKEFNQIALDFLIEEVLENK